MHSLAEGEGDERVGLGLGLGLWLGEGDGLVGEGDGLVGVGDGLVEAGLVDGVGVGVAAVLEAGGVAGEVAALELGVGLAVLAARAVRWAAHEFAAAAGAGAAVATRKPPATPAGMTRNPEIALRARRVMVCRLLMGTPSPPSSPSGSRSLP